MIKRDIFCRTVDIDASPSVQLFSFADKNVTGSVDTFHKSLPGYSPTQLIKLSKLAEHLGINEILVKDESQRFDLKSFKVLGASFAIAKHLGMLLNLRTEDLLFQSIMAEKDKFEHVTFVTATDGNHGKAVAWAASLFGCKSVVFMPRGSSQTRLCAVKSHGARASITTMNYDDTVIFASKQAQKNGWILLQDTSWKGYEEIPKHIMQGYSMLITEYLSQESEIWPTHVFVQAGVGSLAAGILACLRNCHPRPMPKFIVVEPSGAPCLYESNIRNKIARVKGDLPTIMAGLACGKPSYIGWTVLRAGTDAFIKCSDDVAFRGMKVLGNPLQGDQRMISGESGAVTLGTLFEIMTKSHYKKIRKALDLNHESKVLLFSTEGDTDPNFYREIVWR